MKDHIVFRSDSLAEAASELNRLIDALENVSNGLSCVDTSAEWWSGLNIRTSSGRDTARGTLRTIQSKTSSVRTYFSDITEGIRKTQALFEETNKEISASANGAFATRAFDKYNDASSGSGSGSWDGFTIQMNNFDFNPITGGLIQYDGNPIQTVTDYLANKAKEQIRETIDDAANVAKGMWSGLGTMTEILMDSWKTGASFISGKISDCAAAIQESWESKGGVYRFVKGVGAVADIAVGTASLIGAIAGTGITAGMGTGATVLVGAYGVNKAISGIADLVNCITGNVDAIGNVNVLKSVSTGVCGQVGEWLGDREIGESVGSAIYTAGELATVVVSIKNLAGQIKQSATAANTLSESVQKAKNLVSGASKEASKAVNGVGAILKDCGSKIVSTVSNGAPKTLSSLGNVIKNCGTIVTNEIPYGLALLSKQVPNITTLASEVELIGKGVGLGRKVIDKGIGIINSLANQTILKQPSIFSTYDDVSGAMSAYEDVTNSAEDIKENISMIMLHGI